MKKNRKILIGMAASLVLIMAACENSSEKSSAKSDNEQQETTSNENNKATENKKEDTDKQSNEQTNEQIDEQAEEPSDQDSAADTESLKDEYLKKLNETKKKTEEMRKNPPDSSTYAMKNIEGNLFDIWDGMLNEIYQVLIKQLPADEMDKVRKEQREWLAYRDKTAKEASLKYKGGTQEQLEYVAVENNLTADRCFELVEKYMK